MATLYLSEQGSTLRKEHNRLVVARDAVKLAEIHDFRIDRVVVFGNVQVTTHAIAFLLSRGIDTSFFSLNGRLKGRLASIESRNVLLRSRQVDLARDESFALAVAKSIVCGKIHNCAMVLKRYRRNHPDASLERLVGDLDSCQTKAASVENRQQLRGIEGQAAALYFRGFGQMFRKEMAFTKRTRRPPGDPVNAILSFGYTLLYNETIGALASVGFDPYVGFFHTRAYGRCSLALDIMEEMRPVAIDRLALHLVNLEVVKAADFEHRDGGVFLSDEARKKFFTQYERIMTVEFAHVRTGVRSSLRRAIHDQALTLQRTVLRSVPYQTFQGWR